MWADAHKQPTGNWPMAESGPIHDAPGETWYAIEKALRKSARGLRTRSSLFQLLLNYRGVGRHVRKPPLSVRQILRWADEHKRRTGAWPKDRSGVIPGTNGETWARVSADLRVGRRGLAGGSSLAKLLAEHRGLRND